jgi:hypothetical protein
VVSDEAVGYAELATRIRKVPGSNIDPEAGHPQFFFVDFFSSFRKNVGVVPQIVPLQLQPRPSQFIIH